MGLTTMCEVAATIITYQAVTHTHTQHQNYI